MRHPNLQIVTGDVRDPHFCKHIYPGKDTIFHLAALIAIPYSYVAPDSYVDTNIKGTLNMCQAAKRRAFHGYWLPLPLKCTERHAMFPSMRNIRSSRSRPIRNKDWGRCHCHEFFTMLLSCRDDCPTFQHLRSSPIRTCNYPYHHTQIANGIREIKLGI
jgi:hypothetical protein